MTILRVRLPIVARKKDRREGRQGEIKGGKGRSVVCMVIE